MVVSWNAEDKGTGLFWQKSFTIGVDEFFFFVNFHDCNKSTRATIRASPLSLLLLLITLYQRSDESDNTSDPLSPSS